MSPEPYLIGIAGPSCSGKSEVSRRVAEVLGAPILSLDSYYRDLSHLSMEERARVNFDAPDSMDEDLLIRQVRELAHGMAIRKPIYDFTRHTPSDEYEFIEPAEFVIVEGLFALHWKEVRDLLDTRVFISADHEICFERRLYRDVRDRGRSEESVERQYRETVRPMCDKYILPTLRYAHLILNGVAPLERSVRFVTGQVLQTKATVSLAATA
jgi:uridine kinase